MYDHYNKQLKDFSRELRSESVSRAEKYLWKAALSRKQLGVGFKRQRPIDYFIVDFFSKELKLIVEIDGSSHFRKESYDRYRQDKLETLGYTIIRFSEGEVLNNYSSVHEQLIHAVYCLKENYITDQNLVLSSPCPPPKGEIKKPSIKWKAFSIKSYFLQLKLNPLR